MSEAGTKDHAASGAHQATIWPFVIAIGAAVGYVGLVTSLATMFLGIAIFVLGAVGWLRGDLRSVSGPSYGTAAPTEGVRVSSRKLATWLFLVTEIMFFSAIIGASWTLRQNTTTASNPWALPGQILNVPITGLNTFILICSSLTMVQALASIERGDQRRLRIFLSATLLLGITFLSIQAYEYTKLFFTDGLTFTSAPHGINPLFGSTFYAQTGVHGAHVTVGVLAMAYTTLKAFRGGFTKENHEAVELVGLYWHFVDVVWIFLFPIVYLI